MITENQTTETTTSHHQMHLMDDGIKMSKRLSTNVNVQEEDSLLTPIMDFRKLMAWIGAIYSLIMTVIVVPIACLFTYTIIFPLMLININFFNKLSHALCIMVNDHWTSVGQYSGLTITEYGDDISKISKKRVLFLANHLGLVDHFCLMTSFYNKEKLTSNYLWVIYNIWKSTTLGIMWQLHGNFFINGGANRRNNVLNQFKNHLKKNYWKHDFGWIVMYPEGSRLYLIKNSEKNFCEKNDIIPFKNCAHPRIGAAHTVLDVCGPVDESYKTSRCGLGEPIEYVVDCTLGYPKGKIPALGDAMLGEWPTNNTDVGVHFKVHKAQPTWSNEETLKQWLYEQYEKKDQLLEDFYKTGKFPGNGRPIQFPLTRNIFVQVFWMALYYAHYNIWFKPLFGLLFKFFGF